MNFQIERLKQVPQHPRERWQGGLIRMPVWITGEDDDKPPFRPWGAMWISLATRMASSPALEPVESKSFSMALDNLVQFACDKKFAGYRPGIIEVKDSALAEYLQGVLADAGIAVECHPKLAMLEELLAKFAEDQNKGKLLPDALSAKRVTIDMMRSYADAATEFYTAKPWQYFSVDDLIAIEAPFVDPMLRYAHIFGNGGIGFFDSTDVFEEFRIGKGIDAVKGKPYWTLFFGGIEELSFGDADLWEDHRLPVASPNAYPLATQYDPKGKHRRPQPDVLAFLEGLMRAIAQTIESEMDSGRWQKTVRTFAGDKTFTLSLPGLQESAEDVRKKTIKHGGIPDRRTMEKTHLDIQRILESRNFSNADEMQKFLNKNLVGKKIPEQYPMTPLEQAQDICYEAFEARGRKRIALAKKALAISPDCVDAYVILAETCIDDEKAYGLYARGVEAGERVMGKKFFKENAGHFWGLTETRPYMRALDGMANTLESLDRTDEAIGHYRELLRLNPNDNQGVRDVLIACLLETGRIDEAETLWKQYKEDGAAVWRYARALITFMQKGDCAAAKKQLADAIEKNPHVPKYLLGDEDIPPLRSKYVLGSEDESALCADTLEDAWDKTPGALDWLEEHNE